MENQPAHTSYKQPLIDTTGLVPPQAADLEEAVLGAMMLEKDAILTVLQILRRGMFYKDAHNIIFDAIVELSTRSEPIDIYTVSNKLKEKRKLDEVGGAYYLTQLTLKVGSAAHISSHSKIIYEKYIARTIIQQSAAITKAAYMEEFDTLLETFNIAARAIDELISGKSSAKKLSEVLARHAEEIERRCKRREEGGIIGIPTGLSSLDKVNNGWQPGDLIVLGARPSMGKTALALFWGRAAAMAGYAVNFYSLETTDIKLADRLVCADGGIDPSALKSGDLGKEEWHHLEKVYAQLSELNFYIDDNYDTNIRTLCAKARAKRRKGECDIIIIDYLQLVGADGKYSTRELEVSNISRQLKMLAKELNIPIILLCQLSRAVEGRGDKVPQLSDLRESGSIEQDADQVMFPWRPEYYKIDEILDNNGNAIGSKGVGVLFRAKMKDGAVGETIFRYDRAITNIRDFDHLSNDPF